MNRVRVRVRNQERGDVELAVRAGTPWGAVAADLRATAWRCDGQALTPGDVVGRAPLVHGACVEAGPAQVPAALEVRVVAGPGTGRRAPLDGSRTLVVGRCADAGLTLADPAASRRHLELRLLGGAARVADLATTNGSTLDGAPLTGDPSPWPVGARLRIGRTVLELAAASRLPLPATEDGLAVVRPEVSTPPPGRRVRLDPPEEPREEGRRSFPWAAIIAPLVMAAVLGLVMHNRLVMILGIAAPAVAVTTVVVDRVAARRRRAQAEAAHEAALAQHAVALTQALAAEATARRRRAHDTARALRLARREAPGLWDRDQAAWVPGRGQAPAELLDVPGAEPGLLEDVPLVVPLPAGARLLLSGPEARAAARSLVLQACTALAPGRLDVAVLADHRTRAARWAWADLLPQRRTDLDDPDALAGSAAATLLVLVDGADVDDEPLPEHAVVVRVDTPSGRPTCTVATTGDGSCTIAEADRPTRACGLDGVDETTADAAARALAPYRAGAGSNARTVPDRVGLHDLVAAELAVPALDADAVALAWRSRRGLGPVPLGIGPDGVVHLDLPHDGPHALVGGTTGAGKSELVTTLVTGLALLHSPDAVSVLLVDFKGGATGGALTGLPHVCDVVTDLDPATAGRALVGLEAELKRRERLLAEAGVTHVDDVPGLPRLVIVVDEYRVLAEEHPAFLAGLLRVATTGRSLGVHLVLATQRPAGIVSADVRANVSVRIALRLNDVQDSRDVVDAPDAAHLPAAIKGRAVLRRADGDLETVQIAHAAALPAAAQPDVVHLGERRTRDQDGSALPGLVALAATAAERLGLPRASSPVPAPLPAQVDGATLTSDAGLPLGIVDLPALQRTEVLAHDPARDGHLAVVGVARSGRTTALRQVLAAALADAHERHVHVIGGPGLVEGVVSARLGSVVEPTHTRLVRRLLETLRAGAAAPTLLLVDTWSAVVAAADPLAAVDLQAALARLLAEGPGRGVHVVVAGERSLLSGALASHLTERLVLRLADPTELALLGLPLAAAAGWTHPGRALRAGDGALVQLARPPAAILGPALDVATEPLRLRALPDVTTTRRGSGVIGLGGDTAEPVRLDVGAVSTLLVVGPAGSGRSTALSTIGAVSGREVVRVARDGIDPRSAQAVDALAAALGACPEAVVLVDDLDAVADQPVEQALVELAQTGRAPVVLAASPARMSGAYRGLGGLARRNRTGIVLGAGAPADGEPLGVRLGALDEPRPGRGVLVVDGRQLALQVARVDAAATAAASGPATSTASTAGTP